VFGEERQVLAVIASAFEGDDFGIELQQVGQSALVAGNLPIHSLLIGIAPARMRPDLCTATAAHVFRLRHRRYWGKPRL
jgi:hypothetical protein